MRFGGGSTLPGRVARKLSSHFVPDMVQSLPLGCALVTGTNGKTTTATLLAELLDRAGMTPVHNRTGANLMAGIASALIRESDLRGRPAGLIGVFEVDEAALPSAAAETSPRLVLVNNLFRDQLDRYGELDTLAAKMKKAIAAMDRSTIVVLNADDPLVASIGDGLEQRVLYYGIGETRQANRTAQHAADSIHCASCGAPLTYEYYLFGHMGRYSCDNCGWSRPEPIVSADDIEMSGMESTLCTLKYPGGGNRIRIPLPGLYNVYNVLAATTAGFALNVSIETAMSGIEGFKAAFGRVERVEADGRQVLMVLAKNPAGCNEVIRTLTSEPGRRDVLLALNDNIADGRDVSWIWDVDFEMLNGKLDKVVCSGVRAWDMALRLKYAGLEELTLTVEPELESALDGALALTSPGQTLHIVPTYTAMLDLRKIMSERGLVTPFWEDR